MKTLALILAMHGYSIIYQNKDTLLTDFRATADGLRINILATKSGGIKLHRQSNAWADIYDVKRDGKFYADVLALRALDSLKLNN